MINQTILYLVHTNCNHPKLAQYAKELGVSVNWNPDLRLGRPLSKVFKHIIRYDVGSDYAEVGTGQTNIKIIELVREHKPKYVIWPTMNYEIQEETFQKIRQLGSYVIGWFFDDECRFDEYSRWWIPYMDYFFTCDKASISRYQALGAKALNILVTADPDYFKPTPTDLKFEVSFVGTRSVADRENWFDLLTKEGIEVFAIGKGWPGGYISNDEILKVYSSSKINICFTKSYGVNTRNQIKDKIFDITMCGGFLLCEYVDGIEYLFDIGKEIICFENYSEALSKIRYYLNNGAEREIIAKAGMLRSTAEYSQQKLLKKAFDIIETDTASKTKRFSCSGVDTTPPDNILKLKELYHYRWAQVLQETGFDAWRYEEEYQLARNYSISTKRPASVLLVQLTYPSSPFPGPNLPVGLGYIAEQLELNGIPYDVADLSIESIEDFFSRIKESAPDYIGLSMMSLDIDSHYGLAVEIKKLFPGTKIIAGGAHISFVREKALLDCPAIDFGIAHEGEHALVELLNGNPLHSINGLLYRAQDGAIIYSGNRELIDDLDSLPFPRYQKFKLSRYGQTIALASSRGCPFSCTFCGAFLSMGRKWRARSVQNIVGELEYWQQKGYKNFNFIDSNFFMSIQRVNDLCDALSIRDIKITLTSDGMRAKDADPIMLKKLKQFGLQSVAIGIESANDDILNSIKKGETLADLELCLKTLLDLDINVIAFFIIGLPGETVQHVLNSFAFALKYPNISTAYFFNPNPLPGTELYAYAKQHQMLKATESQIFDNIGGMGNQILLETEELPIEVREQLLELSHKVSRRVELQHHLHRQRANLAGYELAHIETEMQNTANNINQSIALLKATSMSSRIPEVAFESIFTHLTNEEKHKLSELAEACNGKLYVEVGSYLGASSCYIASGIKSSGNPAKLYCVDTWANDAMSEGNRDTYNDFLNNTATFQDIIVPLRGKSENIAKTFDIEIDFLFIDAGHEYNDVMVDIFAWFPKLKPGATVIFHDTGWAEGVQKAVNEFVRPLAYNEACLPNMYWANVSAPQKYLKEKLIQEHSPFQNNRQRTHTMERISISVIIPTRNRAALLYNALESLTSQTYPPECFEIIVIDNGSTDSTVEVCRHFKRRLPHFKCVYDPRPGLHNGRHTGLEEANGDILVYADDDIEALPTWLEGIAESFVDPSVVLVGGKVLPKFESTPPEWIDLLSARTDAGWTLAWYSLLDFGDTAHEIPHEYVWGCNFSIRKDVLRKAGGFHPDSVPQELIKYRGDGETAVSFAIRDLGLKAMYNPKATVYHVVSTARMTVDYIYQRAFNQGVSNSYTSIRNSCVLSPQANYAPTTETILEAVNRGIVDGFNYHQQEVQADSTLREWVFRENYFGDNGLIGGKTADNHNLPKTIQISVSDVCNFKCTSCWIHGPGVTADDKNLEASLFKESKPQIMDIKVYERLVSDLKKSSRPVSISFCGKGEPTLHPRFLDMVKFAYNNGLPSNITTNGSGLTFDMLKELREMQVTLNISLNACNQESHQIFCNIQKDFFNSIIEKLRFFSGSEYSGFISLSFVIGSHNIGNIKKMVELSTGILPPGSAISFYPEWTHTGNPENRVSIGQIGSLLDDLSEVINILSNYNISHNLNLLPYVLYGISVSNDNDEPTRDYYMQNPCSTVDNFMVVLADGRVVPCCRSAYVYGNINERSIFDIWSDRKSIEFRSLAKNICNIKKEAPSSHCFSCDHIMGNDYFITRYHSDIDALMSTRLKHD